MIFVCDVLLFVAVAPTCTECDEADLRATLRAVGDPVTIFHKPINIRAENVARIERHAEAMGVTLSVRRHFATRGREEAMGSHLNIKQYAP